MEQRHLTFREMTLRRSVTHVSMGDGTVSLATPTEIHVRFNSGTVGIYDRRWFEISGHFFTDRAQAQGPKSNTGETPT